MREESDEMDDHSFDKLTRHLGSGLSRRGALRAALGGLVAAAGASALSAEAVEKGSLGCPGGCNHGFCVIDDDGKHAQCKKPPVCAPNGEPGICCSGYHRHDGICCDADDPGAIAITVTTNVFNAITVTTPPNSTIVTVTVPPTPVTPVVPPRRRRRRHHRRGGRH
jgi:hypothetical protein